MRRVVWIPGLAVGALLGVGFALSAARSFSEAFRKETVSFGASYVRPGQDAVVYTRMSHAVGRYEIVQQPRGGGRENVVSGDDWTAAFGVSGGGRLAYTRIRENVADLVLLRPGADVLAVPLPDATTQQLRIATDCKSVAAVAAGELRIWNMETLGLVRLPLGPVVSGKERRRSTCWEVALSGDGTRAVVSGSFEDLYFLDTIDLITGTRTMFRSSNSPMSRPSWHSEGGVMTYVARAPDGWEVREARLDGGADRVIYRTPRFIESAELHRDGHHLLLTLGDRNEFEGYFTALHVFELDMASGQLARLGW